VKRGLDGAVQVFTEAEIRASVVFQLSKLVTLLLKAARLNTGAGAWDSLVAGKFLILFRSFYSTSDWWGFSICWVLDSAHHI
jgi:hypothetical protein